MLRFAEARPHSDLIRLPQAVALGTQSQADAGGRDRGQRSGGDCLACDGAVRRGRGAGARGGGWGLSGAALRGGPNPAFARCRDRAGEQGVGQVIGSPAAPYLNSLARRCALAPASMTSPTPAQLPGLDDRLHSGRSQRLRRLQVRRTDLLTQLGAAGFSWRAYVAGVPGSCYRGPRASNYVKPLNSRTFPGSRAASARTPTIAASPPAIASCPAWSRR